MSRALQSDLAFWRGKRILVASDNVTTVAYINHQEGTRSMTLMDLTFDLFETVPELGATIRARHFPRRLNRTANLLSRAHQIVNTEWTLHPTVASRLWRVWGRPMVDLMATELTTQLPAYFSPYPHPQAMAVDAMSCAWTGLDAYIFPPWAMLGEVLNKLSWEKCVATLIAPKWPNRAWFPVLVDLLIDVPVKLPVLPDLIRMPHNNRLYGAILPLDLHACRVSSDRQRSRAFLRRCPAEWPQVSYATPPLTSTRPDGRSSLFGVSDGRSFPNRPL